MAPPVELAVVEEEEAALEGHRGELAVATVPARVLWRQPIW